MSNQIDHVVEQRREGHNKNPVNWLAFQLLLHAICWGTIAFAIALIW